MNYYGEPKLDRLKEIIDAEVRQGTHSIRASYLSRKYRIEPAIAQQVLSDLVAAGALATHYQILCSGEKQQHDVDREFTKRDEIPEYELTCRQCGDRYTLSEENIILSFEPTEAYLQELAQQP